MRTYFYIYRYTYICTGYSILDCVLAFLARQLYSTLTIGNNNPALDLCGSHTQRCCGFSVELASMLYTAFSVSTVGFECLCGACLLRTGVPI